MNRYFTFLSLLMLTFVIGCSQAEFGTQVKPASTGFELIDDQPTDQEIPNDDGDNSNNDGDQDGDNDNDDGDDDGDNDDGDCNRKCHDKDHHHKYKKNKKHKRHGCHNSCKDVDVVDVIVNVRRIDLLACSNRQSLVATNMDQFSLVNDPLIITPTANISPEEVRLVLNRDGNMVIGADGTEHDLKTPSAQQSGLKIKISQSMQLLANQSYRLNYDFDIERQLVQNHNKCLLKPVLKNGTFEAIDSCQACFACVAAGGTVGECTPPCNPDCF